MALSLDIAANTRQAQAQVKDLGKALDTTADALDDVAREGDKAGDKLERSFRDMVQDAGKAEKAIKDVGDKGFAEMGDNVRGFKDEAVQNFSEVASSFSGDITQMADGVQGLAGGLASALTPGIGIPVAILGAAAGAFLQSWISASEDSKERVSAMYDDMIESGSRFLSEDFVNKALGELGQDAGKLADARERAARSGAEEADVLRAMVGDQESIARVADAYRVGLAEEVRSIQESNKETSEKANLIDAANVKYEASIEWLKQIQNDTRTAGAAWSQVNDALYKTRGAVILAADEVAKFRASVAGGVSIPVRLDMGPITVAQNALNDLQRKAAAGVNVVVRPGQVVWQ